MIRNMNNEYEEEEYELSGGIEIGWKKKILMETGTFLLWHLNFLQRIKIRR